MFVPSETGATYGDLDEQYLTASYRVYLYEADAKKVFAYIKRQQEFFAALECRNDKLYCLYRPHSDFYGLQRSVSSAKA